MPEHSLPSGFRDLEPFAAAWALPTERERTLKRQTSAMDEIQALYDAILPRMDAIIEYLNQFPLASMPADAQRLLDLTFALAEVAPAVELYKQPKVTDGADALSFVPLHD